FSIKAIGLARTQVLSQTQPIWSAILAVLIIGEQITVGTAAGTMGIVAGTALLVGEREEGGGRMRPIVWIIPLVSAVAFSFAPTLRKLGFAYIPSATLALGVANLVAGVLQLGFAPVLERGRLGKGWSRRGVRAALLGGVLNSISALCFWVAIKNGNLVEVVPIRRLSVLLVILLSWLFFRRLERVTLRVVIGALLSLGGGLVIVWSGN
ncbi:MAG: EamA family transporter, partial [bacterium]|nr:EamA family transporter [bacterium]